MMIVRCGVIAYSGVDKKLNGVELRTQKRSWRFVPHISTDLPELLGYFWRKTIWSFPCLESLLYESRQSQSLAKWDKNKPQSRLWKPFLISREKMSYSEKSECDSVTDLASLWKRRRNKNPTRSFIFPEWSISVNKTRVSRYFFPFHRHHPVSPTKEKERGRCEWDQKDFSKKLSNFSLLLSQPTLTTIWSNWTNPRGRYGRHATIEWQRMSVDMDLQNGMRVARNWKQVKRQASKRGWMVGWMGEVWRSLLFQAYVKRIPVQAIISHKKKANPVKSYWNWTNIFRLWKSWIRWERRLFQM